MPFVYYGEEIGMTGDKPDPRLRTPMHWTGGPAAGFTTGVPWAPLQPDSLTANVEAHEGDSTSLLAVYRKLIHLRAAHPALGTGELVPLTASHDAVAAFVRRDGERAALFVANLGETPLERASLTTADRVLPAGAYALENLLGGPAGARLRVGGGGTFRGYVPLAALAPRQAYVFDLVPRAGR
jgi:glycosidase